MAQIGEIKHQPACLEPTHFPSFAGPAADPEGGV